jgi:hypothetical protein
MTNELKESDLAHFTGSETWYRHSLCPKILYTDGAQYVAEKGGAYWLLDIIATNNAYGGPEFKREEFQVWKLKLNTKATPKPITIGAVSAHKTRHQPAAILTCSDGGKDGNESKVFFTQEIEYTDFPLPEITLWFQNNTIFLPSEY